MESEIDIRKVKIEDLKNIDLDLVNLKTDPPGFEPQRQYWRY